MALRRKPQTPTGKRLDGTGTVVEKHPTPEEMDERIVAPEGTTFEDVVEALVSSPPQEDQNGTDEKDDDAP